MNMFAMSDDNYPSERVINAASVGRLEDLRRALDDGGDPDYVRLNVAPTLITTFRNYEECLALLIERGARPDVPNQEGWTALHEASKKEETTLLEIVLRAPDTQVRMFAQDKHGHSALFAAMEENRFENAKLLLQREPTLVDTCDKQGITPVMFAAQNKNAEWLEFLLKAGADINSTTEDQKTLADFVGPWDEGRVIMQNTRAVKVDKTESAPKKVRSQTEDSAPVVEPPVKENAFQLGGVRKKTM